MGARKPKARRREAAARPAAAWRTPVAAFLGAAAFGLRAARLRRPAALPLYLARNATVRRARRAVPCDSASVCGARPCDRVVVDDFVAPAEVDALRSIAARGYDAADAPAAAGGPTIFDINSGFARAPRGKRADWDGGGGGHFDAATAQVMAPGARLANIYQRPGAEASNPFAARDYELYRSVIRRLKAAVEAAFPRETPLYFTAPTFLTRLSGENASWRPAEAHDEYYHWHVDRDNTAHYEFSGLLYLSDYGDDFDGGLFSFDDHQAVEPRRGRLSLFASSSENPHRVAPVTRGQRLTLSFWFTCDADYEFKDFLDGKAHVRFREGGL